MEKSQFFVEDNIQELIKQTKLKGINRDLWAKLKSELSSQAESNPIADIHKVVQKYDVDISEPFKERVFTTKAMSAAGIQENIRETILSSLQHMVINNSLDQLTAFTKSVAEGGDLSINDIS